MRQYLWVVVSALLSGCGLPPAVMIASYAADGVSYVATGKSVSDHGISEVTGRDCALWRVIEGNPVCRDEPTERADPAPVEVGQQATLPPATDPGKSSVARQHYLVLGSFVDRRNAERLAEDNHGQPLAVVTASVDGRLTHRVIAGPLSDREAARLRQRLADEDRPRAWEIAALPPGA
ncbi:MAG TPA: SPOR domain-containing protein [Stellaceae bacterium]|nr:SPOR domain-containing protein [Stellaceae bacterium]